MPGFVAALLLAASPAAAPVPVAAIEISVTESGAQKIGAGPGLIGAFTQARWRVLGSPAELAASPERCVLTGTISVRPAPTHPRPVQDLHGAQVIFTHPGKRLHPTPPLHVDYALELTSESGAVLAHVRDSVEAMDVDARAQVVNAVLSALTASLTAHVMPVVFVIDDVVEDGEVRALKSALAALPRSRAVDDGHFSNGVVRFELTTPALGSGLVPALGEVEVGGKHLDVRYAGVDRVTARLQAKSP